MGGPSATIRDYRDLIVWQEGMELAQAVYGATNAFPREELYGLTAQMRRAAVSIPSNIAEGFGRSQRQSFINFLRIAQGSLKELETQVELARRLDLLGAADAKPLFERTQRLGKRLVAYQRSLMEE